MRHLFSNPLFLVLLALLPCLTVLALWAAHRRKQALAQLGNAATLGRWRGGGFGLGRLRGLCWLLGMLALGAGSAGPQWGKERDQAASGRDLIVVLDCSRSMLAENPSRLRRARLALLDLCGELQKRGGHRLGLVVFAGKARLACPLTHDYDHFRETLGSEKDVERLPFDPDLAPGPRDASGTRIGAGLQEALRARDPRYPGACEILLLSDGDDPARDREWDTGAAAARDAGVPVYTVGVGSPSLDDDEARLIINREVQKGPDGKPVLTRLKEKPLREIAQTAHGRYVAMQTRPLALGRLYLDWVADKPVREETDDALPVYQPRYLWFLTPAFVLLLAGFALPVSRAGP
jgi:Ca-activated chloride channel family protein